MSVHENKEIVRQFIEQVMNMGNAEAIPQFMVRGSMLAGAFEGFVTQFRAGFPDAQVTIDALFAEDNQVVAQTTLRATQTGTVLGHPPTGKTCQTTGIYIFKLANGKIVSGQWVFDRMEIAQQLGWMPMPGMA